MQDAFIRETVAPALAGVYECRPDKWEDVARAVWRRVVARGLARPTDVYAWLCHGMCGQDTASLPRPMCQGRCPAPAHDLRPPRDIGAELAGHARDEYRGWGTWRACGPVPALKQAVNTLFP